MGDLGKFNLHNFSFVQIEFRTHPRKNLNGSVIPNYTTVKALRELGVDKYRLLVQIEF